jgi:DNA polymerase III delta subunit
VPAAECFSFRSYILLDGTAETKQSVFASVSSETIFPCQCDTGVLSSAALDDKIRDALLSGKGPKALRMLDGLLREGQERLMMLSLLGRQCRQLYYIAVMLEGGKRQAEIAGELGLNSFVVPKLIPLARRYTSAQLKKAARLCTETEYLVKSGQMMDAGSLEKVMLEIMSLGKEHT